MEQSNLLLIDVKEVARITGFSMRTIWSWVEKNQFPTPLPLGRLRRWRKKDIENWLEEKAQKANPSAVKGGDHV